MVEPKTVTVPEEPLIHIVERVKLILFSAVNLEHILRSKLEARRHLVAPPLGELLVAILLVLRKPFLRLEAEEHVFVEVALILVLRTEVLQVGQDLVDQSDVLVHINGEGRHPQSYSAFPLVHMFVEQIKDRDLLCTIVGWDFCDRSLAARAHVVENDFKFELAEARVSLALLPAEIFFFILNLLLCALICS